MVLKETKKFFDKIFEKNVRILPERKDISVGLQMRQLTLVAPFSLKNCLHHSLIPQFTLLHSLNILQIITVFFSWIFVIRPLGLIYHTH